MTEPAALPTYFVPHGGGPWPFVPEMAAAHGTLPVFLGGLLADAGARPRAIVVVSGHWEEPAHVSSRRDYSMLYDYGGFPEHTYRLQYPAPGSPEVAAQVVDALATAGIAAATERERGYDPACSCHSCSSILARRFRSSRSRSSRGSIRNGTSRSGARVAPLRREGVLIAGGGLSFHNLRAFGGGAELYVRSRRFDDWLNDAVTGDPRLRDQRLADWASAPEARFAHPRPEHLLPLLVAAGAADGEPARRVFAEPLMGAATSGFRFG